MIYSIPTDTADACVFFFRYSRWPFGPGHQHNASSSSIIAHAAEKWKPPPRFPRFLLRTRRLSLAKKLAWRGVAWRDRTVTQARKLEQLLTAAPHASLPIPYRYPWHILMFDREYREYREKDSSLPGPRRVSIHHLLPKLQ